ncbi:MAG: DUF2997 domain-containing protein [Pirellulaceae bacterium]
MSQTIRVIISPQGDSRLETRGFTGGACQQASQFLEQALGQRSAEQLTSEFYLPQRITQPQSHGTGLS